MTSTSNSHSPSASPATEPPVPICPAPWTTKCEVYWLFLTLPKLPEGIYDPLEWETPGTGLREQKREGKDGEFMGGLGGIMVVRYRDTPAGTYDELLIIPGNFLVPRPSTPTSPTLTLPSSAMRISRIYVNQRTTTYNGRLNWNIPKHLARFTFSAAPTAAGQSPPSSVTVKVYPPNSVDGDGTKPFFAATVTPWRWIPPVPVSSKYIPLSTKFAQPPIPGATTGAGAGALDGNGNGYGKGEREVLVGTSTWKAFQIDFYCPRVRGAGVRVYEPGKKPKRGEDGDAEGDMGVGVEEAARFWPNGVRPWGFCTWMEDAEMRITETVEWKV